MIRQFVVAALVVTALTGAERPARANGRLPATSTITFRHGHETDIAVGLTFGLLMSHDGGATWQWMCEDAVGYSGAYDPVYAYAASGALFATTFNGLAVMRDGCTFEPTPTGTAFVSTAALDPSGLLYFGSAQIADAMHPTADFRIYKSLDDDKTMPAGTAAAAPADVNVWWTSIAVAPSNASIVYLAGYRYVPATSGSGTMREHLLFRSDNAGATWQALPTTGLTLMANSRIFVAGIWKDDPAHVYLHVEYIDNTLTDAVYVTSNSGASWTEIRRKADRIGAFVVRGPEHQHDLVLGTIKLGAEISHDDGSNWTALANAPHMGCLVENSAGELWACTQNYGVAPAPTDGAGVMKTTDLTTWTKVLRYEELTHAVSCAAGTKQHDVCDPVWCGVCQQLSCTPASSYNCPVPTEAPATTPPTSKGGGCCDTGTDHGGTLALALSVATVLRRPRRRRGSRCEVPDDPQLRPRSPR